MIEDRDDDREDRPVDEELCHGRLRSLRLADRPRSVAVGDAADVRRHDHLRAALSARRTTMTRSPSFSPPSTTQWSPSMRVAWIVRCATLLSGPTTSAVACPFGSCVTPPAAPASRCRSRPARCGRARTCRAAARDRGFGNIARNVTEPVPGSTVMSVNCSVPASGYSVPSSSSRVTFAWSAPFSFSLSARNVAAQLQPLDARLIEVDIDRIDLLDGRHQRRARSPARTRPA